MNVLKFILSKTDLTYDDSNFNEVNGSIIFEDIGVEILLNYPEVEVDIYSSGYLDRLDDLHYILLDTNEVNENSIYKLKMRGVSQLEDPRLGWVFSMNSLNSFDQLSRLYEENKFGYIFAVSAIQKMVYSKDFQDFINIEAENLKEKTHLNLEEIYGSDLAIAVVSKEAMKNLDLDLEEIKVILMDEHYVPKIKKSEENNLFNALDNKVPRNAFESISMNKLSDSIDRSYLEKFESLLRLALYENNNVSSFLSLYQILEYLSLEIFKEKINSIQFHDEIDSWKLKELLSGLTNESSRLNLAFNNFLNPKFSIEEDVKNDLSTYCQSFLSKCSSDSIQSEAYVKLLYKVRNTLVHKQIDLPSNTSEDLFEINKVFFKVVFQLLKGFDKELGLKDLKSE